MGVFTLENLYVNGPHYEDEVKFGNNNPQYMSFTSIKRGTVKHNHPFWVSDQAQGFAGLGVYNHNEVAIANGQEPTKDQNFLVQLKDQELIDNTIFSISKDFSKITFGGYSLTERQELFEFLHVHKL